VNKHLLESEQKGGPATSVKAHLAVANHYGVPTIHVPRALARAEAEGKMTWKQYGGVHPNVDGYRFVCQFANEALAKMLAATARDRTALPPPLHPNSFDAGTWIDPAGTTFSEGDWIVDHPSREHLPKGGLRKDYLDYPMAHTTKAGASLTFSFEGTAVGAFLLAGPDAGQVEVRIDGGKPRIVDLYHDPYSGGLHYPRTRMFAEGLAPGKHTLVLKVLDTRHAKSKGTACSILYFAVNQAR